MGRISIWIDEKRIFIKTWFGTVYRRAICICTVYGCEVIETRLLHLFAPESPPPLLALKTRHT